MRSYIIYLYGLKGGKCRYFLQSSRGSFLLFVVGTLKCLFFQIKVYETPNILQIFKLRILFMMIFLVLNHLGKSAVFDCEVGFWLSEKMGKEVFQVLQLQQSICLDWQSKKKVWKWDLSFLYVLSILLALLLFWLWDFHWRLISEMLLRDSLQLNSLKRSSYVTLRQFDVIGRHKLQMRVITLGHSNYARFYTSLIFFFFCYT